MGNRILPYDQRQKYQIGDICKIARSNNEFRYPPINDEETCGYGLYAQIVGSYWQLCGTFSYFCDKDGKFIDWNKNLVRYSIIIPKHINHQCYNEKGEWEYNGSWSGSNEPFGWAWLDEKQFDFVRHPTKEEKEFALKEYWDNIDRYGRAYGWKDVIPAGPQIKE